jgi:predicted GNAT family acetyltransferase
MNGVTMKLDDKGHGAFYIMEGTEQLGEMVMSIADAKLTVYHTEVIPKAEGKGYAKKLLEGMVAYIRANGLRVVPLCPYVLAQFKKHEDVYADIWYR